jgi:hypothetical protein
MSTNANIGYDTVFAIKVSGSFVDLAEVFEVTPPEVRLIKLR